MNSIRYFLSGEIVFFGCWWKWSPHEEMQCDVSDSRDWKPLRQCTVRWYVSHHRYRLCHFRTAIYLSCNRFTQDFRDVSQDRNEPHLESATEIFTKDRLEWQCILNLHCHPKTKFEFWLGRVPPPKKLKFRQILELWVLTWQSISPTPLPPKIEI